MSERKVLNKYYPPDFDPSKVPRLKRKNKQNDVRLAAPFNMQCEACGNYIARNTKFNAKKETVEDQTYHKLLIFRFYIKCSRCMNPIVFRTDPKEIGYEIERGAKENFRALKDAGKRAAEEAEAEQEAEKIDPMKQLESRRKEGLQRVEASEQIQQLRHFQGKINGVDIDSLIRTRREEEEPRPAVEGPSTISDEARRVYLEGRKKAELTNERLPTTVKSSKRPLPSALSNLKKKITRKPE